MFSPPGYAKEVGEPSEGTKIRRTARVDHETGRVTDRSPAFTDFFAPYGGAEKRERHLHRLRLAEMAPDWMQNQVIVAPGELRPRQIKIRLS